MKCSFTSDMVHSIKSVIAEAAASQKAIRVYAEAERIRQGRLDRNIALEDIVERFVAEGKYCGVAFEIDPAQAVNAVMGISHTANVLDD